jgi:hypothetical protein
MPDLLDTHVSLGKPMKLPPNPVSFSHIVNSMLQLLTSLSLQQNAHQGGDFDNKVMKHVLKCFARANAGQGDGPRAKPAPPGSSKRNPTKLTPHTTKRLMDGKAPLGTKKARITVPAGSVKRTPQDAGRKQGASTHRGSNKNDHVQPLKEAGNRRPKRLVREIDYNVDANSEAGYSSISDSAPSETASWVAKSKPQAKIKIKPSERTIQKKEMLKLAPNEDPNHFLNQSWWRTKSTQKRFKKLHVMPFDFQQCMVASIRISAEIANPDDKDTRQVARGSKRLKVQAKDQLKLCCPICQKEFKASQGIGYLTEEVMSRHVAKCSEKVFQDNLRQLAVKPMDGGSLPDVLIAPDNVVSMANPASQVDVVAQKPIRMSLKEQEDRDASHAARAQSNYFLMHGEGEQGFMDMLFKNSE